MSLIWLNRNVNAQIHRHDANKLTNAYAKMENSECVTRGANVNAMEFNWMKEMARRRRRRGKKKSKPTFNDRIHHSARTIERAMTVHANTLRSHLDRRAIVIPSLGRSHMGSAFSPVTALSSSMHDEHAPHTDARNHNCAYICIEMLTCFRW